MINYKNIQHIDMADGRKIRNATGAYSISTAVPIDSVVKNTDPYISYMSEWNDMYWYQRTQQKYINTPEGNIEVSTGRKMSFSYYYTSKDHLGSIWHYWSSLNNSRANIYYPSGIMREKRRSPYNYGLTGKEIVYDNGLDEYFFGARTLFAPINRFNQPDPLCEEYYHISPYAYCANNFINALDPTGMDIWEINNEGRIINRIKDRTQDAFFMVALNENGEYQRTFTIDKEGNKQYNNIIFNYGTIESQNSISYYNQKQNKKDTYDEYKIRGDTNGKSLFEFLSFNVTGSSSQVEIGLAQTGIPGDKGLNFITTGHIKGKEPGGSYLMSGRLYYNYTIRSIIHSHPISKYASPNDIGFKDEVNRVLQQYQLPIPQYQIFHVPSKRYINF